MTAKWSTFPTSTCVKEPKCLGENLLRGTLPRAEFFSLSKSHLILYYKEESSRSVQVLLKNSTFVFRGHDSFNRCNLE